MRIKAKIQRPRSFVEFYAVCFGVGNVFFGWFVVVSSALFCLSVVWKKCQKGSPNLGKFVEQKNLGSVLGRAFRWWTCCELVQKKILLPKDFVWNQMSPIFFSGGWRWWGGAKGSDDTNDQVKRSLIILVNNPRKEALFLRLALGVVPNQIPNQNLRQMCLDKSTTVVRLFLLMEVAEKYSGSQLLNTESARRATWIRISTSLNWVLTHTAKKQLEMTCFHLKPRDWSLINIYADPSNFKILKNDNGCFIIPGDIIVPTGPGY